MSTAVKETSPKGALSNKVIALGVGIFSVVEAIVAYFIVFNPLYVRPVFHNTTLDEQGISYTVKFFGKLFASEAEKASGQVIISFSDTVFNIILIYLIITVVPILLTVFLNKGYAFAKTYLTAVFGAKTIIGMVPLLIPFPNIRNSIRIFGVVDAVICLCACAFFVYLNSVEYAEDMLYTESEINTMKRRAKTGGLLFVMTAALMVFEKYAMRGYGINWSIYLGWADQQLTQGYALVAILAVALVAAILYIRDADWAACFYGGFGAAAALSNLVAVINKLIWVNTTHKEYKALALQGDESAIEWIGQNAMGVTWWRGFIFIILSFVAACAITFFAVKSIKGTLMAKPAADEKKPALVVLISVCALILCFILTIAAITMWDKKQYSVFEMGAMDYVYFIIYGGVTLFLALALLAGYEFSKWGMLATYIVVGAANFSTIFKVFSARKGMVAANPGYVGYDYIISGVLYILSLVCCLSIIILFVFKDVSNYLYNKRNS
ncbi:MAG: hypothetical protein NC299_09920 [Lachnospiraceae bacterium]|nr:hypothetical protein [Ruminococcus sp.]MCM1275670.1 hypothetical protein [Lachnospiraceae bacterium]